MLRCIVVLYQRCLKAVTGSSEGGRAAASVEGAKTVTWNVIKASCGKVMHKVTEMKFFSPRSSDAEFAAYFSGVQDEVNAAFDDLADSV
jgi:vacuolar-type H+-ATPase catalytic subunit A/Vma1